MVKVAEDYLGNFCGKFLDNVHSGRLVEVGAGREFAEEIHLGSSGSPESSLYKS